jgi:hypothetical protein
VVRSIVLVAALLLGLLYSAMFLMWNAETRVNVVVLNIGGPPFWIGGVPIGILPIVGAIIGAAVMAIAAWVPWANQRAATKAAEAKLKKAMERLASQKTALAQREEELAALQAQLEELQAGATVAVGAEAEAVGSEEPRQEESAPPETPA